MRVICGHGLDATAFPNDWKQLSNGSLLNRIEREGFDILVTNDKRMQFQQNLKDRTVAILVLPTRARPAVLALLDEIVRAIRASKVGEIAQISGASAD